MCVHSLRDGNNGEKGDLDGTAMFQNTIVVTSASVSLVGWALIDCSLPHMEAWSTVQNIMAQMFLYSGGDTAHF